MPKLQTAYRLRQKRRFKNMQSSSKPKELGANTPEETAAMLEQSTIQPPEPSQESGQEPENAPPAPKRPSTTGIKKPTLAKKPSPRTTRLNKGKAKLTAKGKR